MLSKMLRRWAWIVCELLACPNISSRTGSDTKKNRGKSNRFFSRYLKKGTSWESKFELLTVYYMQKKLISKLCICKCIDIYRSRIFFYTQWVTFDIIQAVPVSEAKVDAWFHHRHSTEQHSSFRVLWSWYAPMICQCSRSASLPVMWKRDHETRYSLIIQGKISLTFGNCFAISPPTNTASRYTHKFCTFIQFWIISVVLVRLWTHFWMVARKGVLYLLESLVSDSIFLWSWY